MTDQDVWVSVVVAFLLAFALAPLTARALPRLGLVSVPNDRSSHSQPTPAGVGLVVPLAAALALLVPLGAPPATMAVAGLLAALGFADDAWDLPAPWRLAAQTALAVCGVLSVGIPALWIAPAALAVVAAINGVNFMDGINGITSLHGVLFGTLLALAGAESGVGSWTVVGLVVAAGCLGYLPNNFPVAKSFPGDVLPYFLASLYTLGLIHMAASSTTVLLGFAALVPMALDTSTTMWRRLRNGEAVMEAHRGHAYQRLSRQTSHASASLSFLGLSISCGLALPLALVFSTGPAMVWLAIATVGSFLALVAVPKDW